MPDSRLYHRIAGRLLAPIARFVESALATVLPILPGQSGDALVPIMSSGSEFDKSWAVLKKEFTDAREAWRKNPLARRIIGLITSYVMGGEGVQMRSAHKDSKLFEKFLKEFANHPQNQWLLRQHEWCDELSRAGELFPTLHTNPADGMSYVRAIPASEIQAIDFLENDYEAEIVYYQRPKEVGDDPKKWYHPRAIKVDELVRNGENGELRQPPPVMLHFAINRPIGCVRGESDLAPILVWLKYYSRWLEDRVRLNAALRAFLWIVKVPGSLVRQKAEQYKSAPAPGSVLVVDRAAEEWEANVPDLNARDVSLDGRALRWMVVAGGPGMSLLDIGESETANLASSRALAEQRRRFLRRRQAYFSYVLASVVVEAWNRSIQLGIRRGRLATVADVEVGLPDISPEDNVNLTLAAEQITTALQQLGEIVGPSAALKRLAVRLFLQNVASRVSDEDFDEIVGAVMVDDT